MENDAKLLMTISFTEVALPPFQDILILGKKCPQGKVGVSRCLNLLAPDDFELVEVENSLVEAILVNKKILKRMPSEKIVGVLAEKVFPYITKGEIVKVDFKVTITYDKVEVKMD